MKDWSSLEEQDFWKMMEEESLVYLYDLQNNKLPPPSSFSELIDDPNRFLAAVVCRKYAVTFTNFYFAHNH